MSTAIATGTGHSRHANGHATMGGPAPETVRASPTTSIDPWSGELVVELGPEGYREARLDAEYAGQFGELATGSGAVFREVLSGRYTGRWFVRRLTPTGWATESEATVPDRAGV